MDYSKELYLANFKDLSLHESGKERCQPGKVIQLDIKDYHLFHYIASGAGTFIFGGQIYHLKKGDLFYIPPHMTAKYYPNETNPWTYVWVGFNGTKSDAYVRRMNLSQSNPIYHGSKDQELRTLFLELSDKYNHAKYLNMEVLSIFIKILYRMMVSGNQKDVLLTTNESHIKMTKQFIENNFQFKIKITDIADSLSISPNYLANIFKTELGITPKEMLTEYRMKKATEYLNHTQMLIKDVALKVGYSNALHFSAEFKRVYKVSPLEYRNQHTIQI